MRRRLLVPFLGIPVIALVGFGACGQQTQQARGPEITKAIVVLHPTEGNDIRGTVTFTKVEGGVRVIADIEGLTPGDHGFHIHEYGDCSSADGKSAGGHFNPDGNSHGSPTSEQRHVGDLGNILADNDGKAHLDWTDTLVAFSGPRSIIGRAVVVHAKADDLTSQPSGAAGPRVACGVIGIARP